MVAVVCVLFRSCCGGIGEVKLSVVCCVVLRAVVMMNCVVYI